MCPVWRCLARQGRPHCYYYYHYYYYYYYHRRLRPHQHHQLTMMTRQLQPTMTN